MAYMLTLSRRHGIVWPPAFTTSPITFTTGPSGIWSPGIHSGYSSVTGPGLTPMLRLTWKTRREASVASTCTWMGVCADRILAQKSSERTENRIVLEIVAMAVRLIPEPRHPGLQLRVTMARELLIQCPDGQMKTVPLTDRISVGRSSASELCFPEDAG